MQTLGYHGKKCLKYVIIVFYHLEKTRILTKVFKVFPGELDIKLLSQSLLYLLYMSRAMR